MSLKAKLEAVIYAAEEPVTLAQLSALFATEALEWKATQEAVAEAPAGESESSNELPTLVAELDPVVAGAETESVALQENPYAAEATAVADGPLQTTAGGVEDGADAAFEGETAAAKPSAEDTAAEVKRAARQHDREVRAALKDLLDELMAAYASDDRGIEIKEIAGGYRMATKPECHDAARLFVKSLKPTLKLSLPALETLAVIAYKQPVTAPEVNEIRGVDSSGVVGSLLARKLIATAGRKQVIGRPILYKTTKEFLLRFGLKDVSELPSMEEFEKIAQLEFEEAEPVSNVDGGSEAEASSGPEYDEEPDEIENETAATADRQEAPESTTPATPEPAAESTTAQAEHRSAEAEPAAPSSTLEQAEIETVPHD